MQETRSGVPRNTLTKPAAHPPVSARCDLGIHTRTFGFFPANFWDTHTKLKDALAKLVTMTRTRNNEIFSESVSRAGQHTPRIRFPAAFGLGADLELFFIAADPKGLSEATRSRCWALAFGPVGGGHPIWTLLRFEANEQAVTSYELFWRACPGAIELFRWASRIIGTDLAARLIETVGILEPFYERYFAARPDCVGAHDRQPLVPHLTIRAATALQVAHERSSPLAELRARYRSDLSDAS